MTPDDERELPNAIAEGTLDFGGVSLRTVVLDNGERVILAEDFDKYIRPWLDALAEIPDDEPA
jgi:hypothetical protein